MANKEVLTPYGILVIAIVLFGGFLFGYHTAVIAGALVFLIPVFELTSSDEGIVVSIMLLGGLIGALISGYLAERIGRKKALLIMAFLITMGALVIATASSYFQLLAGRAISGFAIGIVSVVAPLYLGELAPPNYRGGCVSAFQLFIALGVLFSFVTVFIFSESKQWQMLFVIGASLSILQLCALFFIPETPSWTLSHGRTAKATQALTRFRQDNYWKDELENMHKKIRVKQSWADFLKPHMPYILMVGCVLSAFQQITGINAVIYYTPKIFQTAGIASDSSSFLATLSVGTVNFLATLFSLLVLDKIGRRVLLLVGALGMALSLCVLSYAFFVSSSIVHILTVVSLMSYVACFAFSFGPVTWVLLAEIFPLKIRGNAIACALGLNWFANYIVSLLFPDMIVNWGSEWAFGLFAAISLAAFFFVYFCIPETKGKTLEQIETLVDSGKF